MSEKAEVIEWARMLLRNPNKCVILDTETTGLGDDDEIIELAIINTSGKTLMNQRFKPLEKREFADATAIHGIEYKDLKDCPTIDAYYDEITQLLKGNLVLIYNAKYDKRLLKQSFKKANKTFLYKDYEFNCVMLNYSAYLEVERWQKLQGGDHSALGDCIAALDLIKMMSHSTGSLIKKKVSNLLVLLMGNVLLILGVVFMIFAPLAGGMLVLSALFVLPAPRNFFYAETGRTIPTKGKGLIISMFIVAFFVFIVQASEKDRQTRLEVQQQVISTEK